MLWIKTIIQTKRSDDDLQDWEKGAVDNEFKDTEAWININSIAAFWDNGDRTVTLQFNYKESLS